MGLRFFSWVAAGTLIGVCAGTVSLQPSPVLAQDGEVNTAVEAPRDTVMTRPHPWRDPLGLKLGSMFLYPSLTSGVEYSDNVFRTQTNRLDDFEFTVAPRVDARSLWERHALNVSVGGLFAFHEQYERNDFIEAHAIINGRVDITRLAKLNIRSSYNRFSEDRGDPNAGGGREPTVYDHFRNTISFTQELEDMELAIGVEQQYLNFYDDDRFMAPGDINHDDRDRGIYSAFAKVGFDISPAATAFVRGDFILMDRDDNRDDLGFRRDNYGFETVVGVDFNYQNIWHGEVFAGFMHRDYEDGRLRDVNTFTYGVEVNWNVAPLTTISLNGNRKLRESGAFGTTAYTADRASLSVSHELSRSFVIRGVGRIGFDDFIDSSRADVLYGGSAQAFYHMNRYMVWSLAYDFTARDTNRRALSDYTVNEVNLKLTLQY